MEKNKNGGGGNRVWWLWADAFGFAVFLIFFVDFL